MTPDVDLDIPDWVPGAVRGIAPFLPVGKAVAQRLLTDHRMKSPWRVLESQAVTSEAIGQLDSLQRLETWGISNLGVPLHEQACAAFFSGVVLELGVPKNARTGRDVAAIMRPWRSAAAQCQIALNMPGRPGIEPELASALSASREYFEDYAQFLERAIKNSPYFFPRSSGKPGEDQIRGKVRAIAVVTQKIFGSFLCGTVATVATVALQLSPNLKKDRVIDWCSGLRQ
jgi:hypothetical protein